MPRKNHSELIRGMKGLEIFVISPTVLLSLFFRDVRLSIKLKHKHVYPMEYANERERCSKYQHPDVLYVPSSANISSISQVFHLEWKAKSENLVEILKCRAGDTYLRATTACCRSMAMALSSVCDDQNPALPLFHLCLRDFAHRSQTSDQYFVGSKIPCSVCAIK